VAAEGTAQYVGGDLLVVLGPVHVFERRRRVVSDDARSLGTHHADGMAVLAAEGFGAEPAAPEPPGPAVERLGGVTGCCSTGAVTGGGGESVLAQVIFDAAGSSSARSSR